MAIKPIDKSVFLKTERARLTTRREIEILKMLAVLGPRSPHLVQLKAVVETDTDINLVLEYAEGGKLFDHIIAFGAFAEKEAATLFAALVGTLAFLHSNGIMHRDLKPENSCAAAPTIRTAASSSWAEQHHEGHLHPEGKVGSAVYVAPEMLAHKPYTSSVDIWSAGIILYVLLSGTLPFYAWNPQDFLKLVAKADELITFPEDEWGAIPKKRGGVSDEAKAPQGWMGGERHTFHCYGQGNIRPVDPEDYMKTHNAQITDPDQAFKHAYLGMRGVSEESVKLALDKQAASKYDANGRVIVEADENDEEETKQPVKTGGFLDQEPPRNNAVGGGGKSGGKKKRGKKGGKKGDVADPEASMRPVTIKVTARPARFLPVKKKRDDGNNGNNGNNGGDRRSEANGAVVLAGGNGNTGINGLIHSDQQTHADVARREEIRRVAWEEAEYARESAAAVAAYVLREDDVGRQRFLEARQYKHEPFQPFVEDHLNPRTYQRLPPQWTKNIRPAGCKPAVRHTSIADLLNQFA